MFKHSYKNKKVLVTGHTGFKGTWLSVWLLQLGAKVIGISKDIPTNPSMFSLLGLSEKMISHFCDIRDFGKLHALIKQEKPDFIFHLAAQAIVSVSYSEPLETISSNVMGTTNLLESLRLLNYNLTAIIITSDKAYDNVEQVWGYKENDFLGGKDIYSGSKGAADILIKSYFHSFFSLPNSNVKIAVARAGNVIGGGDWAKDRIVADCMRAWSQHKKVEIRYPRSTRPWQHVLEPLSGYLWLGCTLKQNKHLNGEAFNFGPRADQNQTVEQLIHDLSLYWDFEKPQCSYNIVENTSFHEARLLKLNCDKALSYLNWQANWGYKETVEYTSKWYYTHYRCNDDIYKKTLDQITCYEYAAKEKSYQWTLSD